MSGWEVLWTIGVSLCITYVLVFGLTIITGYVIGRNEAGRPIRFLGWLSPFRAMDWAIAKGRGREVYDPDPVPAEVDWTSITGEGLIDE